MKFDQDLCLNLQYDFGKMNSTLGSVVPLAMFFMRTKRLLAALLLRTILGCSAADVDEMIQAIDRCIYFFMMICVIVAQYATCR